MLDKNEVPAAAGKVAEAAAEAPARAKKPSSGRRKKGEGA